MKPTLKIFATIFAIGVLQQKSAAAISVTNLNLTTNSVTFSISGTFPSTSPTNFPDTLYVSNPNPAASPGFALAFAGATSNGFTGT
jgi:hypothetical protein